MDWRYYYIMIAIAVALISLIGMVILGVHNDLKGYKNINNKIGSTEKGTLSVQHENMEKTIIEKHADIKGMITERTNLIFSTVNNIDKELVRQQAQKEYQYKNLSESQKEMDSHVKGIEELVQDWKRVVTENKEIKEENALLIDKNKELMRENQKLRKQLHPTQDNELSL